MSKDSFDDLIESEVRKSHRPKMDPPPGMVGTSASRTESPRFRLTTPPHSPTAGFFSWLGVATAAVTVPSCVFLLNESLFAGLSALLGGAITSALWFAISGVLSYLNAAAHWSEQTAKAVTELHGKIQRT